jgi:hypothetical protein
MKNYYRITMAVLVMMVSLIISQASFAAEATPGHESQKPLKPPPDIKAYKLEVWPPESPVSGQTVFIKGYYSVTGCVSNPFFGKIDVDGRIIGEEKELPNMCPDCMNPNCSLWWDYFFEATWEAFPGNHTITFTADSKNNIHEGILNEHNNKKSVTVNVPMPDIRLPKAIDRKPMIPKIQ